MLATFLSASCAFDALFVSPRLRLWPRKRPPHAPPPTSCALWSSLAPSLAPARRTLLMRHRLVQQANYALQSLVRLAHGAAFLSRRTFDVLGACNTCGTLGCGAPRKVGPPSRQHTLQNCAICRSLLAAGSLWDRVMEQRCHPANGWLASFGSTGPNLFAVIRDRHVVMDAIHCVFQPWSVSPETARPGSDLKLNPILKIWSPGHKFHILTHWKPTGTADLLSAGGARSTPGTRTRSTRPTAPR